jgi:Fur family ferric uptake transcriptional regulator
LLLRIIIDNEMTDRKSLFLDSLRSNGFRVTRQRQLILEVLDESREHLDAVALYERVKARDARIGLATVYRTLALLVGMGLVEEHSLGEEHGHFESVQDDVHHYHFSCASCGRVIEFEAPAVMQVVQTLIEEHGVQVEDIHLFIKGYCAQCQVERWHEKPPD